MSEKVIERYDLCWNDSGNTFMGRSADGSYVCSSDYDALRAKLAERDKEIERLKQTQHDEYCDSLDIMIPGKPCNCYLLYKERAEKAEAELAALRERMKYLEGDNLPDSLTINALKEWLSLRGYDGLFTEDAQCQCVISDLCPCGEGYQSCQPGYKAPCNHPDCFDTYHIQAIQKAVGK